MVLEGAADVVLRLEDEVVGRGLEIAEPMSFEGVGTGRDEDDVEEEACWGREGEDETGLLMLLR